MTQDQPEAACTTYVIVVQGHLEERWADWFGGLTFTYEGDGTTTLQGAVPDQAALHGLLNGIRDLGLPLLSVQKQSPDHKPEE